MGLDGTFKLTLPEGDYGMSLHEPPGFRLTEITYAGVNLMKEQATFRANDRMELRVRLVAPTTRVIGDRALTSRCVSCTPPPYPSLARTARVADTVTLEIVVAKDGTVADVKIIRGHQLLRQAALDAVLKWVFQSEGSGTISIVFADE
jgi:TonB family protein